MSSWNPTSQDSEKKNQDVKLPQTPASAGASPDVPNIQMPPVTTTSTATSTATTPATNHVGLQSFSHQQSPPVLPPPSSIGNGQSPPHMYKFPPLSNLNKLPRYNNIPGGQTQLPSFNSISKGAAAVSSSQSTNIALPSANQLLSNTTNNVENKTVLPPPPPPPAQPTVQPQPQPQSQPQSQMVPAPNTPSVAVTNNINSNVTTEQTATVTSSTPGANRSPTNEETVPGSTPALATNDLSEEQKNPNYKPLNVKDALYYLDQVKLQFRNQTDVYNNFLDIMKDFKSQNIDTPGVIERVSSLFKGHPKLIDGFNTFLPQGFSIECSTSDANTIIVTTPMGTSIRRNSSSSPSATVAATTTVPEQSIIPNDTSMNNTTVNMTENTTIANQDNDKTKELTQGDITSNQVHNNYPDGYPQNTDYQQQDQQQMASANAESKQSTPAEFDQAINYVNKIKQRYASQPDIYKLFLENLQMYQKGLKPINEVYREISVLFRDAPDLLEDFKLFMPDNTVVKDTQQQEYGYSQYYPQNVQLPPVGNFQSGGYSNGQPDLNNQNQMMMNQQQYSIQQQSPQDQLLNQGQDVQQKHSDQYPYPQQFVQQQYQSQKQLPQQQPYSQDGQLPVKDKKKKGSISGTSQVQALQKQGQLQPNDEFPVSNLRGAPIEQQEEKPALIAGVLEPIYPKTLDTDLSNELAFFDKVKKEIGNKQTYNEFLKLLKLFSSDVIDKQTLHDKAKTIIGGFPGLFEWFKNFIGYEETPLRIENIAIKKQQLDLLMCKAAGPSYRQLPKSQTKMPCSGRDDLCWSIFNDEWVGHPVWASEESGFIAHRKNQYEEMLFRIEDERHEYDYFMEANLRTIQTLETIANRMANMTPEEKSRFKLPVGLGHTSSTIYVKVIRKIYDKDRGWEVIDALHEHPAITVPIVLKRLKQKDEEWKRAHREWNKVWREAEQKLMIKSLDHLGLSFKNIDKKLLTNKQLVSEISTIKQEQANKKLHPLMTRPKSELVTKYEDFTIFMDILKLVNTNLKHNQVYSQNDKERMEAFMKSFIIKFFFIDQQFIDAELKKRGILNPNGSSDTIEEISKEESTSEPTLPTLSQTKKRPREYDLLKDVLRKNKRKKNDQREQQPQTEDLTSTPTSAAASSAGVEEEPISEELQKAQSNWLSSESLNSSDDKIRDEFNMFANTQIYVFYRHLDTLYKRLLEIKKLAPVVNKEVKSRVATKFADDLGLIDHHLEDLGIAIKGNDSYNEALELCVKLIDNKLEQSSFEESLRNGFRNKAFKLFTIDRVIQSLMKHCHTLVSDSKCSEILMLMEKDRNQVKTSTKDQILYRIQVRSFMNQDENMFKITYNRALSCTTITFLALDDLTIKNDSQDKEHKWNYYLTSYSMSHPTEGLDSSKIRLPFLKSQLDNEQENENEIEGVVDSKLSVKVDVDSYRMRFEPDSYDLFIRNSLFTKKSTNKNSRKIRVDKLDRVINGDYGIAGDLKEDGIKLANKRIEILKEKGPEEYLKFNDTSKVTEKLNDEGKVGDTEPEAISDPKPTDVNTKEGDIQQCTTSSVSEAKPDVVSSATEEAPTEKPEISSTNPQVKETTATSEVTVTEGDSTIQQDETVEKENV